MIDLITGLPGNCKTLYTIAWLKEEAAKENRPVYYSGIPLTDEGKQKLGWTEIEPEKWMEAPPKSIVVIDECQRIFRNRSINTVPPKFVSDLETHRHLGIDLVFITQHPMLIDPAVRRLTGRHRHCVRQWGMESSTIHEWGSVREDCDKPARRGDSIKHIWKFNKEIYPLYKSAELHTVKRNIPWKVKLLLLLPFVLAAIVYRGYVSIKEKTQAANAPEHAVSAPGTPGAAKPSMGGSPAPSKPSYMNAVEDKKQYLYEYQPRLAGFPHTAPRYDDVTKPTTAPLPASCMATKDRCVCYTQQATRMPDVPEETCRNIVGDGYFVDFDPDKSERREERTARSVKVLDRDGEPLPLSGASTAEGGRMVTVMDEDGYGVLGRRGARSSGDKSGKGS
jgi:zona occludens toxin